MNDAKQARLNIGAGQTYIPGFINIDISDRADIALDLGKDKLPFEDDSVDLIFSYATLEHIPDYLFALSEIHRVLKQGGHFLVGLPYVTLTEYHLVNPFHLHNFNEFSFDFFEEGKLKGSASESSPISFRKAFHKFSYIGFFNLMPPPFRSWCRRHLFNVVRKIEFGLIAVKRTDAALPPYDKHALQHELLECVRARIPYGQDSSIQDAETVRDLFRRLRTWWNGGSW